MCVPDTVTEKQPTAALRPPGDEGLPVRGPVQGQGRAGLVAPRLLGAPGGPRVKQRRRQGPGSAGAVRRAAAEICGEEAGHQDLNGQRRCFQ